jgi:hypothetical protein
MRAVFAIGQGNVVRGVGVGEVGGESKEQAQQKNKVASHNALSY